MKKTTKRNNLLELKPSSDWKDPAAPRYPHPKGKTYTSGTYNKKLTGYDYTSRADTSLSDSRPLSHGKGINKGGAVAKKGAKVKGAQRGVGQETLDGLTFKKRKSVKR